LLGPEDAAGPVAFRFMLGMLLAYDAFRYVVAGWPDSMFLQPAMLFKYWGFEWVEPLPRVLHHAVFYVSTGAALGIALGYRYRLCATLFFLGTPTSICCRRRTTSTTPISSSC
jgi:uncharacterized membrane protein YphA (DoxX/SURF4 family)